jgi:hypothetical protein
MEQADPDHSVRLVLGTTRFELCLASVASDGDNGIEETVLQTSATEYPMSATLKDIPSLVRSWSSKEKQIALATILGEHVSEQGTRPFVIEDESSETVGYLMPRPRIVESALDDSDYTREIRARVATWEDSIPVEELNAQLDSEENRPDQP